MININTSISLDEFIKTNESTQNNWIHLTAPSEEKLKYVTHALDIPSDFLTDALDINERPRIEERAENMLLIIHVPYDDPDVIHSYDEVKFRTIPLAIIHSKEHLVTVCCEDLPFMEDFCIEKKDALNTHIKAHNTLAILSKTAHAYIDFIKVIEKLIVQAEDELSRSYRNKELYTLLYLNESLLYMTTSLKQMQHIMRKLKQYNYIEMSHEDAEQLSDVLVELERAYAVTEINQLNLNNVMDAYGNIIQNNVSHVVKFLTALTIVFSVPTMIASIYGMNVPLPFQDEPYAFEVLIASMVVFSGLFAYIFYKKRYF